MQKLVIAVASFALLFSAVAATAQEGIGEVSAQLTGQFTRDSNGFGYTQSATNSAGLLAGYRHKIFRWISVEGDYGFTRNTQRYFLSPTSGFPFPNLIGGPGLPQTRIQADVHQATGGLVFNLPFVKGMRPYLLAEGGALVFAPTRNSFATVAGTVRDGEGLFVYGGGVELPVIGSHLLALVEYRGLIYHAPDFGISSVNTTNVTHTAQPSVGLAYRF